MKDPFSGHYQPIDRFNGIIDNLVLCLQTITVYFKYLPYGSDDQLTISLTYDHGETESYLSIDNLVKELKRCILYQESKGDGIDIRADLKVSQKVFVQDEEVDLFYYGSFSLYNGTGVAYFNWYEGRPLVEVDLFHKVEPELMLSLYVNFQEAIRDQINKIGPRE